MTRSVFIVDDDDAVRASLRGLLAAQGSMLVRVFRSGDDFLESIDADDTGVVVLDFHMPGANGLEVLRALGPKNGRFAAIVLTGQGDVGIAVQAMKAGAVDFMEKPSDPAQLLATVEQGFLRLEQDTAVQQRVGSAREKIARLSAREHEVLLGLIEGRANKVIAHDLDLSPRTVEIYRANMMEKLGVTSLSEALRLAFAAGLVDLS
ncbi:MAG: response regulator transcription factor [Sphingomonas sp.]